MKPVIIIIINTFIVCNITFGQVKPINNTIQKNAAATKAVVPKLPVRYRITINSFYASLPTADHILEVDGKGDEIFFTSVAVQQTSTGGIFTSNRSLVFGDINNDKWRTFDRIKVGSKPGGQGGIAEDDKYPSYGSTNKYTQLNKPNKRTLPFIICEGVMDKNGAVSFIPTIWEYDGTTELERSINTFTSVVTKATSIGLTFGINAISHKIIDDVMDNDDRKNNGGTWVEELPAYSYGGRGVNENPDFIVLKTLFGDAHDRPIGMRSEGGQYVYKPKVIDLNYDKLVMYSNKQTIYGKGVYPIYVSDAYTLGGDYRMYIQIETVNEASAFEKNNLFSPYDSITSKAKYILTNVQNSNAIPKIESELGQVKMSEEENAQWEFIKVPGTENQFYIKYNDRALDVLAHSKENNGKVILYPANNAINQRWYITPLGDGSFTILGVESNKALSYNYKTNSLEQYENRANPDQRWKIE